MLATLLRRYTKWNSDVAIFQLPSTLGVTCRRYSANIPTSGDNGPGKNYRKKLKKETNKNLGLAGGGDKRIQDSATFQQAITRGGKAASEQLGVNTDSLLQQLEQLESNHEKGGVTTSHAPIGDHRSPSDTGLKIDLK